MNISSMRHSVSDARHSVSNFVSGARQNSARKMRSLSAPSAMMRSFRESLAQRFSAQSFSIGGGGAKALRDREAFLAVARRSAELDKGLQELQAVASSLWTPDTSEPSDSSDAIQSNGRESAQEAEQTETRSDDSPRSPQTSRRSVGPKPLPRRPDVLKNYAPVEIQSTRAEIKLTRVENPLDRMGVKLTPVEIQSNPLGKRRVLVENSEAAHLEIKPRGGAVKTAMHASADFSADELAASARPANVEPKLTLVEPKLTLVEPKRRAHALLREATRQNDPINNSRLLADYTWSSKEAAKLANQPMTPSKRPASWS